jgi:hypothetical protein
VFGDICYSSRFRAPHYGEQCTQRYTCSMWQWPLGWGIPPCPPLAEKDKGGGSCWRMRWGCRRRESGAVRRASSLKSAASCLDFTPDSPRPCSCSSFLIRRRFIFEHHFTSSFAAATDTPQGGLASGDFPFDPHRLSAQDARRLGALRVWLGLATKSRGVTSQAAVC